MGIETNEKPTTHAKTGAPTPSDTGSFETALPLGAKTGSHDFLAFSSSLGINRIDETIAPYIEKMMKLIKMALPDIQLVRLNKVNNAYAIRYDGQDGIINLFVLSFISMSDSISSNMIPASNRLRFCVSELNDFYKDKQSRIVDARIIIGGYAGDMDRADIMADRIVRTFQVTADNRAKNAQISVLTGNEFVVDRRIEEARIAENSMSPHGVRPRMDVGLVLKAKIKNELGRDTNEYVDDYHMLGVIGGYAEIRDKEPYQVGDRMEMRYRPVFHITVCNAQIPLEGVAALMMTVLAPQIVSSNFWITQWRDLSKGQSNPGFLDENPEHRGNPIVLQNQEDLLDFVSARFAPPIITFDFQDGRDSIPNLWRMGSQNVSDRNTFYNRIAHFFNSEQDVPTFDLSTVLENRYDGVYGERSGTLNDSRDIDYLHIAAKNGWGSIDQATRATLIGGVRDPAGYAKIISLATNSFYPVWYNSVVYINPDFFKWVSNKSLSSNLQITDPNSHIASRPISDYITGFGSYSGMNSIVSSGVGMNRGLNLGSYRSYFN